MHYLPLLKETVFSGTIASLVMMPAGFLFQHFGQRVGHYGPKFAGLFFDSPGPAILFAQHILLGWISALPLLLILPGLQLYLSPVTTGAAYGAAYYVTINSLALPLLFGDPTPWQLGVGFIYPSLVVHIIFGASIGFTSRKYAARMVKAT